MTQHNLQINICPCGSGQDFSTCCEPYAVMLPKYDPNHETVLISWLDKYSCPIEESFRIKAGRYIFRISIYADYIFDSLCPLGFRSFPRNQKMIDEGIRAIKHNIILSLIAALSCHAQGLFLQSGSLIRNCIEDALVLLDICENEKQLQNYLLENYSANNVLKRVKHYIPEKFRLWYGHFSANFTHFGPLHSSPYMPRACYADNYVLGAGIENIILGIYFYHIILERVHFSQLPSSIFWKRQNGALVFSDENNVSRYISKLLDDLYSEFPPGEKKKGYNYSEKVYRCK
jgi:hypothetical protein